MTWDKDFDGPDGEPTKNLHQPDDLAGAAFSALAEAFLRYFFLTLTGAVLLGIIACITYAISHGG